MPEVELREQVALAPLTTLGVGGSARYFSEARDEATLIEALEWASRYRVATRVLGGGSNLVVSDAGYDGLVVRVALRGTDWGVKGEQVELTAAAGEPWDALVELAVERGWGGFECLSGIPGLVGATPIQNVGAYGQEVSESIVSVRAYDRLERRVVVLSAADCRFGYRDSVFKSIAPERWVVLAVSFRLVSGGAPRLAYPELVRELERQHIDAPALADVRRAVLDLRRSKSMVIDAADENRRSCGSFFVNPVVLPDVAENVARAAGDADLPRFAQPDGRLKLSAAWLIERAGFARGSRAGCVGLSTRHTLALVCQQGARAGDVVAFARRIRAGVERRFGIRLVPEPVFWGFTSLDDGLPDERLA
jgi:UDP-N-acetylmuramate dehydrogenase